MKKLFFIAGLIMFSLLSANISVVEENTNYLVIEYELETYQIDEKNRLYCDRNNNFIQW